MSFFKSFSLILTLLALTACSSNKSYENQVFPKGKWQPVNTQNQTGEWQ